VVTGGASGLGLSTATELRRRGAEVVIADLASSPGAERAKAIGARFEAADVTDPADVERAVSLAADLAPLRALVCCAGVATPGRVVGRSGPLPLEDFDRVLAINLSGTFNAIRMSASAMAGNQPESGDRGVIVLTSSVAAFDGQVGQAAYAASKGGVASMVLPLARELAQHAIRVMAIAPGMFRTPLLEALPADAIASLGMQVPHPARVGDPHEYADLVGHVLDNGMLNGEVIRLDGAIRMAPR
jgi:NAD(P)-dependent dehydrogenase (short-subunit alcohol dehydrogenase family)